MFLMQIEVPYSGRKKKILPRTAAYTAKSLQSCPTLCDPIDGQPIRLPCPWDSPGKNTGVGCHFLLQYMKVKSESKSLSPVRLFETPWTAAYQAPLSMDFSRQEHWSGLPCPPPGDLPKPGIEPTSLTSSALAGGFFTMSHQGSTQNTVPMKP